MLIIQMAIFLAEKNLSAAKPYIMLKNFSLFCNEDFQFIFLLPQVNYLFNSQHQTVCLQII